jgi:antitoxin CptB
MNKKNQTRLQWACRRGMLELDLLLGNFLKEAYPALSERDAALFGQLLEENDQDLYLWLTGKETTNNQELNRIIGLIRHHAENRHSA